MGRSTARDEQAGDAAGATRSKRRWGLRAGLAVVALVSLGALLPAIGNWRRERTIAQAIRLLASGAHAEAEQALAPLAAATGRADLWYQVGAARRLQGRVDEAIDAYRQVGLGTEWSEAGAIEGGQLAMDHGRYRGGEELLKQALTKPGARSVEVRQVLIQLLWHQCRLDEVRPLVETSWRETAAKEGALSRRALSTLRGHLSLDLESYPVGRVSEILEKAATEAPEDDRVRLGRGLVALRAGRIDDAARMIEECATRPGADVAVWRGMLAAGVESGAAGLVTEAAARLAASDVEPERAARLAVWVAQQIGDREAERAALESLLAASPAESTALERAAQLAIEMGDSKRAAEIRQRKMELDEARHRYVTLLPKEFPPNAREMAQLAEQLGRDFEAEGFWEVVQAANPLDQEAREARERLRKRARRGGKETASGKDSDKLAQAIPSLARLVERGSSIAKASAGPRFEERADAAGLRFVFESGKSTLHQLPETMAGGVGLIDFDGDGWLDVYAVQGGVFPPSPGAGLGDRLFRNLGDGRFEDATERAGLSKFKGGYGHGVTVGDVNRDGHADLFVTRYRGYGLYLNRGDGTFSDETEAWGLGGDREWPTSAALADLDGDGDLDLYVCHYLKWDETNPKLCRNTESGKYTYCAPLVLEALPDHLFRNDGDRFVDVSSEAGITAADTEGRGLGVVAADLDEDGKVDLYVANDGTANFLWRNLGGMKFEDVGHASGVAGNAEGGYQAGMGLACGDLDRDGRVDLAVTNFYDESTTLYQNMGGGAFADRSAFVGLRAATRDKLGFGIDANDFDDDGRVDLFQVNGHVNDLTPFFPYAMPGQVFVGAEAGRMVDVSAGAGEGLAVERVARGVAAGDLDNDGRIDVVGVNLDAPLTLFRNTTETPGHWLMIGLEGTASNRDGVGTVVTVEAGGARWVVPRFGGGSYLSSRDPRLHVGLGAVGRVERLEVRWPSGRVDRFEGLEVDAAYRIREGDAEVSKLKGYGVGR